ncbi:MAG: two-component system, CitB family, sensor kinase [Subtercola sp.]|nr:two-component system, CitB family, sensor kinase [Subtercola sp.]
MIAWIRHWSISRRLFALQFVFILLLTAAALAWLWNDARGIVETSAADHSLSVATSIADNPFVVEAIQAAGPDAAGSAGSGVPGSDPSILLEPYAQNLMADTATDFITIMAPDRTRYTHPNPEEIGRAFVGTIEPALEGRTFTETYTGTLGPSVRAVVPILNQQGTVIALVAAGVTVSKVSGALAERLPLVFGFAGLTLLFGALASWLLSRYLQRVTWGRGPEEMSRMFSYYEGVLHSVREGLVLVDSRARLVLHNDQAAELLGLPVSGGVPVAVSELQIPDALRGLLASGDRAVDEIFVTENRVLVVNQEPAVAVAPRRGTARRVMGTVTTLRDHTDLLRISGELQNMRTLSDALRSQTHEHANRLHTIVALIELGRGEEAVALAAGELDRGQNLADQLVEAVEEPVLAALLVGKSAEARERGAELELAIAPELGPMGVPADDLITIVGNLIDNALDAAIDGGSGHPRVVVAVSGGASAAESAEDIVVISVSDNGPGIDDVGRAFERGYSSKAAGPHGRGFGLALVGQSVRRLGGSVGVEADGGAVVTVTLPRGAHRESARETAPR